VAPEIKDVQVARPLASDMRIFQSHGDHQRIWIVDPRVVAPVTPRVHWREVPPTTVNVLPRFVAPEILVVQRIEVFHVVRRDPDISRLAHGFVLPSQTNDPLSKRRPLVIPVPPAMNLVKYPPLHAAARTPVA
jgi:hypothetical protein